MVDVDQWHRGCLPLGYEEPDDHDADRIPNDIRQRGDARTRDGRSRERARVAGGRTDDGPCDVHRRKRPKGGPAIRCALEVKQPRRSGVHVEAIATTQRLAFDGALAKLERAVTRRRKITRDAKRRPKKYFVARRVLAAL